VSAGGSQREDRAAALDDGTPPRDGRVVFVGAGPGADDLITRRGAARLAEAEVVLADALIDPTLRDLAPPGVRWIDVGKRGFAASIQQAAICALLVRHARAGAVVVRLKGGDPSVFGRLEEELEALAAAGVACEVVPGVTAASAAAAATGRPLTRRARGRSVALETAMTNARGVVATRRADSHVYYMAGRQLATLARRLASAGWPPETPVSVVSKAGCVDQIASDHCVATLGEAALVHAGRPTVVIVGVAAEPVYAPLQPLPVILSGAKDLVLERAPHLSLRSG